MSLPRQILIVLKKHGLAIFVLSFLFMFLDQHLTEFIQAEMSSPDGMSARLVLAGLGSMLTSVGFPLLINLLIIYAVLPPSTPLLKNLNQCAIEVFRSMGHIIAWSILLIIPGLIRYLQYSFVPFVVLLDPAYAQGEHDALKRSIQVANRLWGPLLLYLVFFIVFIPIILTFWDEYRQFWLYPVGNLLLTGVQSLLAILAGLALLRLWQKAT